MKPFKKSTRPVDFLNGFIIKSAFRANSDKQLPVYTEMGTSEIIATLQVQGIVFNKEATVEQIAATERVLDFKFPSGFTQFYLFANGFDRASCMTNGLFNIWSLEQIQQEWLADDSKNFIPFGDYLIHSHWIGFLKTKPGVFKYYDIDNEAATCETFTEALILATQEESDLQ